MHGTRARHPAAMHLQLVVVVVIIIRVIDWLLPPVHFALCLLLATLTLSPVALGLLLLATGTLPVLILLLILLLPRVWNALAWSARLCNFYQVGCEMSALENDGLRVGIAEERAAAEFLVAEQRQTFLGTGLAAVSLLKAPDHVGDLEFGNPAAEAGMAGGLLELKKKKERGYN